MIVKIQHKILIFIFLIGIIFSCYSVLAAENTTTKNAESCLKDSSAYMQELIDNGFNAERLDDIIRTASDVFSAQKLLEENGKKSDYSLVISYCDDVENVRNLAFEARDMFYSLEKEYADFKEKAGKLGLNTSETDSFVEDARQEIRDERYEKAIEKIPEAEKKIIDAEAEATTMNLFYSTLTRGIKEFIIENYIQLGIFIGIILAVYLFYRTRIRRKIIINKIERLYAEKEVLRDLIKKTQKDYFQYGKIPEGIYNIRTKRFAELIRDLDRQIPLLKEELERLNVRLTDKKEVVELGKVRGFANKETIVKKAITRKKKNRRKRGSRKKIKKGK